MKHTKHQKSFQSLKDYGQEIRQIVHEQIKTAVLEMIHHLFEDELNKLCGPRYDPNDKCFRAGSDPGSVYVNGQRVLIKKPRVKKRAKKN